MGSLFAKAGSIAIIGGADGPTAIFTSKDGADLVNSLILGGEGMLGIFIVMVLIALIVWALPGLSKLFERKKPGENGEQNGSEDKN